MTTHSQEHPSGCLLCETSPGKPEQTSYSHPEKTEGRPSNDSTNQSSELIRVAYRSHLQEQENFKESQIPKDQLSMGDRHMDAASLELCEELEQPS